MIKDRVGVNAPARFLCIAVEDSFPEVLDVTNAEADSFQDLDFVVAALDEAVRPRDIKSVQDLLEPIVTGSCTVLELRQVRAFHRVEPLDQLLFTGLGGSRVHDLQKLVLNTIGM